MLRGLSAGVDGAAVETLDGAAGDDAPVSEGAEGVADAAGAAVPGVDSVMCPAAVSRAALG